MRDKDTYGTMNLMAWRNPGCQISRDILFQGINTGLVICLWLSYLQRLKNGAASAYANSKLLLP